jgi:XTP/dITP diphosphohydrolase
MRVVVASGNRHKLREIAQILADTPLELVSARELGVDLDPEEWGATFAENAVIKALAFAHATGMAALADDSGLEVAALNDAPGVFSARFAGPDRDDAANNRKLLADLAHVPAAERQARYRCVIALAYPSGDALPLRSIQGFGASDSGLIDGWTVRTFDGTCSGAIGFEPRGHGGFGYDPYFVTTDGRHMAELSDAEKHAISHRGAALAELHAHVSNWMRR